MLEQTLISNGNNEFEDNTFSSKKWSAPTIVSVDEIRERINGFNLIGRKIKDIRFIGLCYNLTRDWIEERAYSSLENLPEEILQEKSNYVNIEPNTRYVRFAEIDEPLLIKFEDETDSQSIFYDGDTFEIDTPQQPEFRMSMNCIPWGINAGTNSRNVAAKLLFAPCIGQQIRSIEVNTYITDVDPMFHMPFDEEHSKRELVSDITIWLDNELGICIEGWIDFCHVCCIDKNREIIGISFAELSKALYNWEDLHIDPETGYESKSSSFFFGRKGADYTEQPYISLSSSSSKSVLHIAEKDFCLFDWCISDLFEWFDEYGDYEYNLEQLDALLAEAEKLLSFETFDMLFDYRISLYQESEDNRRGNYFLNQMNDRGAEFWNNRGKYKIQLEDMRKWIALVMRETDILSIRGF